MKIDETELLRLRREITTCPCPALLVDEEGQIRFRNRLAARYTQRQRTLSPLLADDCGPDAKLVLRQISDMTMLVWIAPIKDGFRKVLFLRDLTDREIFLFHSVMAQLVKAARQEGDLTPSAALFSDFLTTGQTATEEPVDLIALLKTSSKKPLLGLTWDLEDAPDREMWTVPTFEWMMTAIGQAVRLFCGATSVSVTVRALRERVAVTFSFPDKIGVVNEMLRLLTAEDAPDLVRAEGILPLLSVCRCCQRNDYGLTFDQQDGVSRLRLVLPSAASVPAFYLQGHGRRRVRLW